MKDITRQTYWVKLYISGPIEVAKQELRAECLEEGLCVTIEPTSFIYTGGEESGYIVGFINYPRFPLPPEKINERARKVMLRLLKATHQQSALMMTPETTNWVTTREQ